MRAVVAAFAIVAALAGASVAAAHEGAEGYTSTIRGVSPTTAGLTVSVIEGDEQLRLVNKTGSLVLVPGYQGEPYLRIEPSGVVQVNDHSPARYLNEDRYAQTGVPDDAKASAPPLWRTIARNGVAHWHDHRIHWMSEEPPPKLKEVEEKTKVFDWRVPVEVGSQTVSIAGTLFWDPEADDDDDDAEGGSGFPAAAAGGIAAALVAVAGGAFVLLRRRRRGGGPEGGEAAESW